MQNERSDNGKGRPRGAGGKGRSDGDNRPQGRPDFSSAAAKLGISEEAFITATVFKTVSRFLSIYY